MHFMRTTPEDFAQRTVLFALDLFKVFDIGNPNKQFDDFENIFPGLV